MNSILLFGMSSFVASSVLGAAVEDAEHMIPPRVAAEGHLEGPDAASDSQMLVGPIRVVSEPSSVAGLRGGSLLLATQANVNASGQNIVGDAANEPSLAINPLAPNQIVIGWRQFNTINNSFRRAGYAYSDDGGRTWTAPTPLENTIFRSDPVLDFDADGNILYCSLTVDNTQTVFNTDFFISGDGGQSWSLPMFGFSGDKQWIAVDRTGGSGHGHVYQSWSTAGNNYFPNQFNRSVDGGCTWESPIQITGMPIWGTLEVAPDGALYIIGWAQDWPATFIVSKSTDAQDPFLTPTFTASEVPLDGFIGFTTGVNPAGLLGQLDIETDHSGTATHGNLYVVGSVVPDASVDPLEVHFNRSLDGGATWGSPMRINDDAPGTNAYQWFAAMDVAPNGRIDVVWYDTRNDPANPDPNTSEIWYSFSTDGGLTFSPNERLTVAFQHFIGYPQQNKLGDYIDIESDAVGAHVCVATTWNGGQDVWYLRINDHDCDGNGTGDTTDIATDPSLDCNTNGIIDSCEIAAGAVPDANGNGIPDSCDCDGDVDGNGTVDVGDITFVIFRLGNSGAPGTVPGDADGNGIVDVLDISFVIFRLGAICTGPA